MAFEKGLARAGLLRFLVHKVGATAQDVTGNVFIADKPYEVLGVQETHSAANGGALTLSITKCTGTTAPASGTAVLLSTFDLNATANTVVKKTLGNGGLSATLSARFLAAGDRLAFSASGASTSLAGMVVVVTLRAVGAKASIY